MAPTNGGIPVSTRWHSSIIWNLRGPCFPGTTWQSLPACTRIPSCGNVRLQPQGLMCRDSCVKSSDMSDIIIWSYRSTQWLDEDNHEGPGNDGNHCRARHTGTGCYMITTERGAVWIRRRLTPEDLSQLICTITVTEHTCICWTCA